MASPSWLHITAEGLAAGTTAAALTYTLVSWCSAAAATSTGVLVDAGGSVAAAATRYFFGEVPAMTVRVLGRMGSLSGEATVQRGGTAAAVMVSAAVGGTTALTVSVGSRLVKATVEYGGAVTQEVARRVAAAYLKYKVGQTEEATEATWSTDSSDEGTEDWGEWAVLEVARPIDTKLYDPL